MKRFFIITALLTISAYSSAHNPANAIAKILYNDDVVISIHHPSNDPTHYVNHVIVKRGSATLLDQEFDTQTDENFQEITIPQPGPARRRVRKGALISIEATCTRNGLLKKEVRIR